MKLTAEIIIKDENGREITRTEIDETMQTDDGSLMIDKYGDYVLELDEQYSRTIKHGCNVFFHF